MIKFDVLNRFTGEIKFTAEIDCEENADRSIKLGLAVKCALRERSDLQDADLRGADLRDTNLQGANLQDADLQDADLRGVDLRRANLQDADLQDADLRGVDLRRANLQDADLQGADLRDADLQGADLRDTDLRDAKNAPLIIHGLGWAVIITSTYMHIGCEYHSIAEWENFDDRDIFGMDGFHALKFWRAHKEMLLSLAKAYQKNFTQENEGVAA